MRKLNTTDLFEAMRLIKKSNLREELRPIIMQAAKSELSVEEVGIDGILQVVEVLSEKKCESAMYDFLSRPFEITSKEVSELSLDELLEKLLELKEVSNLKNFMTALQGLITKK